MKNPNDPFLSPPAIKRHQDFSLLNVIYTTALEFREKSSKCQQDWRWFISIGSHKLTVSRACLSFRAEEYKDFKRFINIANNLLPTKYWLLKGNQNLIEQVCKKTGFDDFKVLIKDSATVIQIGIARDGQQNRWQFSPVLRFFIHMMLIVDETLDIG